MFSRTTYVNTQIKRNKRGRKVLMRTLGYFELVNLVDNTYVEFGNGKSIDFLFQKYSVAKKHFKDYQILMFNKFLKNHKRLETFDEKYLKHIQYFIDLGEELDIGFVYFIKIGEKLKIGRTKNILNRLKSYKSHSGMMCEIIDLKLDLNHSESETYLKTRLKNYGNTEEWFDLEHKAKIQEEFRLRWNN